MLAAIQRVASDASVRKMSKETALVSYNELNVTLTGRINDSYSLFCIFDIPMSNFLRESIEATSGNKL